MRLLFVGLLLSPLPAVAQSTVDPSTLPPTVVTATRVPTPAERLPAAVTVIDRQTIEERGYTTLAEALQSVPGFRLVQTGGLGQQASGFLRGSASRHVLVLYDGVPINDPSDPNGAYNFGNEQLGDIERIEVVRGPASALYGSGALGGVVNMVPRRATGDAAFTPYGQLAGGTQNTVNGFAGATGRIGAFDYMATGQWLSTRGSNATAPRFTATLGEADGFRGGVGTAALGYTIGTTRIDGLLRWRGNVAGLDNVPQDDPNYTGRDNNWFGFVRAATTVFDGRWTTALRLSGSQDRRTYVNLEDPFSSATANDYYRGRNAMLDWSNILRTGDVGPLRDVVFTFGATHQWEDVLSAAGSSFFRTNVDASQRSNALQAGAQTRLFERLDLTFGLRQDIPDGYEGATTWRLGGVLQLPEIASRLRGSVGTGYKAPSLFQRFGEIPGFFRGNPNLRPENSTSWEAGIETDLGRFATATALYFDSRYTNLINFDPTFSTLTNVDRALIRGAEIGLTLRLAPGFTTTFAWTVIEAKDLATGEPLPRRPRNVGSLEVRWQPMPRLVVSPEILFTGRSPEGAFAAYNNDGTAITTRGWNDPGVVVNLGATWRVNERVSLYFAGRNLTNSRYEPANGYVIPGPSALMGVRFGL